MPITAICVPQIALLVIRPNTMIRWHRGLEGSFGVEVSARPADSSSTTVLMEDAQRKPSVAQRKPGAPGGADCQRIVSETEDPGIASDGAQVRAEAIDG